MEEFVRGFFAFAGMIAYFGSLVFVAGLCYQLYNVLSQERTLRLKALGLIILTRLSAIFCATLLTLLFWKFQMGLGIFIALIVSELTLSPIFLKLFGYSAWGKNKEQEPTDEHSRMAERYKETIATWNTLPGAYQERFMEMTLYDGTYDAFCEQLTKTSASVLDIGCGPGNITRYLLLKCRGIKILATDVAPAMIAQARKNIPNQFKKNVDFKVIDSREIGTLHTTFDAIISGFCIPYLSPPDCSKLIEDCSHMLSEKGVLYLSFVPGNQSQSGFMSGSTKNGRTYFYYHDLEFIELELTKNAFEVTYLERIVYEKQDGTTELHAVLIARKQSAETPPA